MIKRYTPGEIRSESERLGLGIPDDELESFARLANAMVEAVQPADREQGATTSRTRASGDVTRMIESVTTEERAARDPLNAIVRFISVKSNEASAQSGAMAGMRVGIKDNIAVADIPMTCASRILQGFTPTIDATVVSRMVEAGAEIVAMTNMEDMAFSGGGESSHYGPIRNPADTNRVSGGSSGGSGASLAYPWVDVTIGGDQGGSVRIPAGWCGVVGIKPTHSLVPYTGALGIDPTIDHLGPMGRTVGEVAKTLSVISGQCPGDPRQTTLDATQVKAELDAVVSGSADLDISGLKVGLLKEGWGDAAGVEPETDAAIKAAVERLGELGATLVEVSVPEHSTSATPSFSLFAEGMVHGLECGGVALGSSAQYWPEMALAMGRGLETGKADLSWQLKAIILVGTMLKENHYYATYHHAMQRRDQIRAAFDAALDDVDVLAMPTLPYPAYEFDPDLPPDESVLRGWAMITNTTTFNMTGHPAITLPTSKVGDGLPVGTMLVGKALSDGELFRIAAAYEDKYGWELGADGTLTA